MESAIITAFLTMIEGLLPVLGSSSAVTVIEEILTALISIVPIIANNYANFLTPVQNIIAAVQSSGAATPAQLASLTALDAQVDAAFDAAAATDAGV